MAQLISTTTNPHNNRILMKHWSLICSQRGVRVSHIKACTELTSWRARARRMQDLTDRRSIRDQLEIFIGIVCVIEGVES